jgi:uncharacterized protein with PQ loop repeat
MLIFGWTATGLSLIYKLPQIYTTCKTKNVDSLSLISLFIQLLSYVFYVVHGIAINDLPIVVMGIVSMLQTIFLMGLCLYHSKR